MYVRMYVCMYECVCVCVCVCISYIYIYASRNRVSQIKTLMMFQHETVT